MASRAPTQLPAYIQLRYEESGVFDQLYGAAEQAAERTKRQFNDAFRETERTITSAVGRINSQMGRLDLGVGDMRQEAAEIRLYRDAVDEVFRSMQSLARETGDTSSETRSYLQALSAQRNEADGALRVAEQQISAYSRLQTELDGAASSTSRLAQSQREVYAAQIEAAQREVAARQAQDAVNGRFAPGLTSSAMQNGAGFGALEMLQQGRQLRQELDSMFAAQERFNTSVEHANTLYGNGAIDLRTYTLAIEQANVELREAERLNRGPANAGPLNNRTGVDALVSGQASMDRAALSGATLESVLGRVSVKSREVAQATAEMTAAQERATAEQQQFAAAVDRLEAELNPVVAATQRYNADVRTLDDALSRHAISAQRHAEMMQLVNNASYQGTQANRNVINSTRALNNAMLQSGQQLQDVAISLYSGQRASVVFAQQLPQLAFALTGLEGSANRVHDRIGRFATFLAGPWGLAVGLAVGVIGTLIYNLIDAGDAAEEAETKTYDFSNGLDVLTLSAQEAGDAMAQLSNDMRSAIAVQGDFLRQSAQVASSSVSAIEGRIDERQAEVTRLQRYAREYSVEAAIGLDPVTNRLNELREQIALDQQALASAREAAVSAGIAVAQSNVIENLDAAAAATGRYERAVGELIQRRRESADDPAGATTQGIFLSEEQFEAEFQRLTELKNAEVEAAREADRSSSRRGRGGRDRSGREAERLARFGDRAAEAISRINERFDEQPRLVSQAAAATRRLDSIIADLEQRQPPGFAEMIEDAERAKATIEDALVRPFEELLEDSERRIQIQELLARGMEDEADALAEIWRLEDRIGDLTTDQKDEIRDIIRYEGQRTRELERQRDLFEAQLGFIDQARASLTDLLSGRSNDFFGDLRQAFADLQGQRLFDSIFGDVFQELEDELRGQSPLGRESERLAGEMGVATNAFDDLTSAVRSATGALGAANDNRDGFGADVADVFGAIDAMGAARRSAALPGAPVDSPTGGEIVVTAKRPIDVSTRSASEIADRIAGAMVSPLEEALGDAFGTSFGQMIGGVLQNALSGYITGGATGGVIGGLQGIVNETGIFGGAGGKLSGLLGQAGAGAATGTMVAGIGNSLGLGLSNTGSQIGGAIGSFIPIPGGNIIGSIAGGLLGSLFSSNRTARALITGGDGYDVAGADSGNYGTAAGLGDSVLSGLRNIVDELGGTLGDFYVSIGTRGDEYRVNTNNSSLKIKNGAVSFGDDAQAAIQFAIMDAISDGAIEGIRDSTRRILEAGQDFDRALQDALSWENVFRELEAYKDPLGAALDELDDEFDRLIEIAQRSGASAEEWAQLEELYGIRRAEIIEETNERIMSSLRDLYNDLTTGDNGLSLRDRRANALGDYEDLAARVAAGDTTAYDDYAEAARNLLDIEREIYGSQQEYFDRLNEVIELTANRIEGDDNVSSIAENRDSPFDSAGAVRNSIDSQTDEIVARLDALIANQGAAIALAERAGGGAVNSYLGRLYFASKF